MGQCPDGRLGASARLRGAAHSGRHGAGVPLRRRGARRRRHHRHAGHLLHPREQGQIPGRGRPLPFARPDGPRADADRRGYPPHLRTGLEPPRDVEPRLLRSARAGRPDDAARTLVAPEFRRHAPGARPALQVPREPGCLQGYPALCQFAIRSALCGPAAAGRGFRRGIRRRRRGRALVEPGDGPARSDRRADGLCGLHARGRRRFRQRPLCRQTPPDRPAGTGAHVQLPGHRRQRGRRELPERDARGLPRARRKGLRADRQRVRPRERPAERTERFAGRIPHGPRRRRCRPAGHRLHRSAARL